MRDAMPVPVPPQPAPSSRQGPFRPIATQDLSRFPRPVIAGNRRFGWRAAWYLVNALFFQSSLFALIPSRAKAAILRGFGAKVGPGLVCKPRVTIKYPWLLEIGAHVWLGERVWIDNPGPVRIGAHVCISQGVRIVTGSHDWARGDFRFFARPIEIGDSAWVTAHRVLRPGAIVPPRVVVLGDVSAGDGRGPRAASDGVSSEGGVR